MYKCMILGRRKVVWGLGLQLFSGKWAVFWAFCRSGVAIQSSKVKAKKEHRAFGANETEETEVTEKRRTAEDRGRSQGQEAGTEGN